MKASVGLYLKRGQSVSFSGTYWKCEVYFFFYSDYSMYYIYSLDEAAFAAGDLNKSSLENMSQLWAMSAFVWNAIIETRPLMKINRTT